VSRAPATLSTRRYIHDNRICSSHSTYPSVYIDDSRIWIFSIDSDCYTSIHYSRIRPKAHVLAHQSCSRSIVDANDQEILTVQAYSIRRRAFCSLSLHILEAHVLTDQASAYEAPCGFTQWESHLAVLSFSLPPPLSKSRARDRGGGHYAETTTRVLLVHVKYTF